MSDPQTPGILDSGDALVNAQWEKLQFLKQIFFCPSSGVEKKLEFFSAVIGKKQEPSNYVLASEEILGLDCMFKSQPADLLFTQVWMAWLSWVWMGTKERDTTVCLHYEMRAICFNG